VAWITERQQETCLVNKVDVILLGRNHRVSKDRLHILHPATVDEIDDDLLVIVLLEGFFRLVPLEEMKDGRVLGISADATVDRSFFDFGMLGRLFVHGFDLVRVFGVGVDLRELSAG
jgi:hypothetical protein